MSDSIYGKYKTWLLEQGMTEEQMPFRAWLEATYPGDASLHRQMVVAEVVGGNLSKDTQRRTLDEVTGSADEDLAAGLTALARTRLTRMSNTMEFVDRVEEKLMRKINIEEASVDQLLSAGRLLRNSLKDDVSLVADVVRAREKKRDETPASLTVNYTEKIMNVGDKAVAMTLKNRDSRDRARSVLDSMIKAVEKHDDAA